LLGGLHRIVPEMRQRLKRGRM